MATRKTAAKKAGDMMSPRKVGRPSKFSGDMFERVKEMCANGATDAQLADEFGVTITTLHNWKLTKPEFFDALKAAKEPADDRVERSLFERAMGYEHEEIDIRVINNEIVMTPIRKRYPPDTTAMIFWLKNRRPDKWRDKVDTVVSGPDGGPVNHSIEIKFVSPNRTT